MGMPRSVTLLDECRADSSSLHLIAVLERSGDLRLEGQDLGPVTAPISPDGEYEYFYTIRADDVPALVTALGGAPSDNILDLLEQRWADQHSYQLGRTIRDSGVPFTFFAYP